MYKTPLQHSSHFFVGSAFAGLADSFARYIRRFADEETAAYFNFYSVTAADSGGVSIATADCDTLSPVVIDGADADNAYEHFFDGLFRDHVNVATPGTGSMLAVIYVPLYDAAALETAKDLIRAIDADT